MAQILPSVNTSSVPIFSAGDTFVVNGFPLSAELGLITGKD
jgi:hypothetical protein